MTESSRTVDQGPSGVDTASTGSMFDALQVGIAWLVLALIDALLKTLGFNRFYRLMRWFPTVGAAAPPLREMSVRATIAAVDRARVYYFKYAWCLQRAATAVCLLRLRGVPARMVIGVRKVPFGAHAWAEVDGAIVGDGAQLASQYQPIAAC